tara:strand:- start:311 stop:574 length:264 start_codon:yes stop_codon:yes gene_type:complete
MSRLQKTPAPTMIEPETFEEIEEEVQYSPQHPTLAFHAELKARITPDHLENYVEVQPFAQAEPRTLRDVEGESTLKKALKNKHTVKK